MSRGRLLLAALAAAAVLVIPALPVAGAIRGQLRLAPDAAVALALLWALQWARGGWRAPPGRLGSWRAALVALPWTVLVAFEIARAITRHATNEDLPLYDALLLSKHLLILGRDLYGALAYLPVALAVLAPFAIVLVGSALLGRVEAALRALGPRRGALFVAAFVAVALVADRLPGNRAVTPTLVRNARVSWGLWAEVERSVSSRTHAELDQVVLDARPDLLLYVVESYGEVCATAPDYAEPWAETVDALDAAARAAGWISASGWSIAPVHGGRSWIADMSLLTGLQVSHQSSYEHVLGRLGQIRTLPRFLAANGYTTVLVKPADRARPGVRIENPYGFARTVFADDLAYTGPYVGWGRIPDQYTIEYVQQHVLDGIEPPVFAFFHLATAHVPWADVPPLLDDWTAWNRGEVIGRVIPLFDDRSFESEVAMRVSRFKRRSAGEAREADPAQREQYLGTIRYDLAAIGRRLAAGPRRPGLVVVMGDHQPPLVAQDRGPEVPVHLFATDPALLAPFLEAGFAAGARPVPGGPAVRHEDLLPLFARALDGVAP